MRILAALTLLLTGADHWTTYLCLRAPVPGWSVTEANPFADWLFTQLGLVPGLLADGVITIGAIAFLLMTTRFTPPVKLAFFGLIAFWTGYAVVNNFQAIAAMGLDPLGRA